MARPVFVLLIDIYGIISVCKTPVLIIKFEEVIQSEELWVCQQQHLSL